MKIKEFYLNEYPTDELGEELNENANFVGLLAVLYEGGNVYEYIGVGDSLIRERLFQEVANQLNKPYDFVYDMWLKGVDYRYDVDITI